jgi:hypothetical protein
MQERFYESGSCVQKNCAILGVHPKGFRPTSVQFKGRINSDKARKRHQTRHLEFYTPQLSTEGLQVRILPGEPNPFRPGVCGPPVLSPPSKLSRCSRILVQKVDTEFAKNLMFRRRKSSEIGRPFGSEANVCEVQPPLSKRLKGKQRHDAFSAALCSILASCELEPLRHRTILAITRIATQPSDRLASPSAQAPTTRQSRR